MMEVTYAMIKPHAVSEKIAGKVLSFIEENGFEVVKMEKLTMSKALAEAFYGEHAARPFFGDLVKNISAGPIIALALKKENSILEWRRVIGATDPSKAEAGTLRALFGKSLDFNVVHGSDSAESSTRELSLLFRCEFKTHCN